MYKKIHRHNPNRKSSRKLWPATWTDDPEETQNMAALHELRIMVKNKTQETEVDVRDFIDSFVDKEQKKADSYRLIELMTQWSGFEPKMWGPSIIGFGSYHYKYASGHEGDAPIIGFSPRKAAISLYVYSATDKSKKLLNDLGKYTMGKSCIYVKKLPDINLAVLEKLCKDSIAHINEHPESGC